MRKTLLLGATATVATLFAASHVLAADANDFTPQHKGTLVVDVRFSGVVPEAKDPVYTAAGAATGLTAVVGDSYLPTLGFTYFVTDKISVEAILGATRHTADVVDATGAHTKLHSTWVIPPVVSVKYNPFPKAKFSPYVGAGVNAMIYFAGSDYNGFKTSLKDEFGYAAQFGADIALKGPWAINVDAKKVFTNTRANVNNGALTANVGLSPWVVSVGLGRRF